MSQALKSAREIVAKTVKKLMEGHPTLNTQAALAGKAGVSQRTISNLLNPTSLDVSKSARLDVVEKVARAFGLEPWALLVNPETFGREMAGYMHRPTASDTRLEELGQRPLTEELPAVRGNKGARKRSKV